MPRRWRVENSWGDESGVKGFYTMNDSWFDEHMFEIAARRSALPPELQEALAGFYQEQGDWTEALAVWERVLADHPDHLGALLYRGLALFQLGDSQRAVDTWELGLEMAGGRPRPGQRQREMKNSLRQ